MIKLISLDLDGTLLNSERRILQEERRAVRYAYEKGIRVIISTGSPYALMPHEFLKGLHVSHAITANGSAVYEYGSGKCIYEEGIDTDTVLPILEFLLGKDIHIDMFINGRGYCPRSTYGITEKLDVPASRRAYLQNDRIWLDNPPDYIRAHGLSMQKMTMNFYPDARGELVDREEVRAYLESSPAINLASGGWGNLEATKKGVHKGKALQELCRRTGISPDETLAIGDSTNDLDIIKTAGTGVAMDNAMPEVKAAADYVTKSNDDHGVAEAIRYFL